MRFHTSKAGTKKKPPIQNSDGGQWGQEEKLSENRQSPKHGIIKKIGRLKRKKSKAWYYTVQKGDALTKKVWEMEVTQQRPVFPHREIGGRERFRHIL